MYECSKCGSMRPACWINDEIGFGCPDCHGTGKKIAGCPFCGEAREEKYYRPIDTLKYGGRYCPDCDASGPSVRTNYKYEGRQPWMDLADKGWDTRGGE